MLKSPSQRILKQKNYDERIWIRHQRSHAAPEVFRVRAAPLLIQKKCVIRKPNIISLNS